MQVGNLGGSTSYDVKGSEVLIKEQPQRELPSSVTSTTSGKVEEIVSQILKVQQRKILLRMCLVGTPVRDVMEVRLIIAVKISWGRK